MQKPWKRPSSPTSHSFHLVRFPGQPGQEQRSSSIPEPDVVSMDALALFTDEELHARQKSLNSDVRTLASRSEDARLWEDELAYVAREVQIRYSRRGAHDKFVRQCEIEFASAEANAPVADLDNTGFLRSIGMLN